MAFLSSTKKNTSNSSYYSLLIPFVIFVAFALSIYLAYQSEFKSTFPKFATDAFTFTAWINAGEDYLKDHYKWITRLIASYVKVGCISNKWQHSSCCKKRKRKRRSIITWQIDILS